MPKERFKQPLTSSDPDFLRNINARLDELYDQAKEADKKLGEFMTRVRRIVPGTIIHPGLKDRQTARDKLRRAGGLDDPDTLMDISRGTIAYTDLAAVLAASELVQQQPEFAKVCDRYNGKPEDSGYRDIKFFLRIPVKGGKEHFVELQLNLTLMRKAVKIDHPVYEIVRRAGKGAPRAVVIPSGEVPKYARELRTVWVFAKQRGILREPDTGSMAKVVQRFFDRKHPDQPLNHSVEVSAMDIAVLRRISPQLYKSYTDQILHAKVVRQGEMRPLVDARMHQIIRHPPPRHKK